jgi:hypothetical protein
MTTRKTVTVDKLRKMANHMLANSADEAREGRVGISVYLEHFLFATGNYHGYRYIDGNSGYDDDTRREYLS